MEKNKATAACPDARQHHLYMSAVLNAAKHRCQARIGLDRTYLTKMTLQEPGYCSALRVIRSIQSMNGSMLRANAAAAGIHMVESRLQDIGETRIRDSDFTWMTKL